MALLVSSDHEKKKRLLGFWLYDIAVAYEMVALTEPKHGVWYWSEKDNDHRRLISKGELDDRLVTWGYASAEALASSVERIRNPRNGPSLEDVLRR